MRRLFRSLGLIVALLLASLATVDAFAWPYEYEYDNCYYYCSDGNTYTTYTVSTTRSACCNTTLNGFWCPPGESPTPPFGWGGTYYILETC